MSKENPLPHPIPGLRDLEFIVVLGDKVLRKTTNTAESAREAWEVLNPVFPEILYVKVGGQRLTP